MIFLEKVKRLSRMVKPGKINTSEIIFQLSDPSFFRIKPFIKINFETCNYIPKKEEIFFSKDRGYIFSTFSFFNKIKTLNSSFKIEFLLKDSENETKEIRINMKRNLNKTKILDSKNYVEFFLGTTNSPIFCVVCFKIEFYNETFSNKKSEEKRKKSFVDCFDKNKKYCYYASILNDLYHKFLKSKDIENNHFKENQESNIIKSKRKFLDNENKKFKNLLDKKFKVMKMFTSTPFFRLKDSILNSFEIIENDLDDFEMIYEKFEENQNIILLENFKRKRKKRMKYKIMLNLMKKIKWLKNFYKKSFELIVFEFSELSEMIFKFRSFIKVLNFSKIFASKIKSFKSFDNNLIIFTDYLNNEFKNKLEKCEKSKINTKGKLKDLYLIEDGENSYSSILKIFEFLDLKNNSFFYLFKHFEDKMKIFDNGIIKKYANSVEMKCVLIDLKVKLLYESFF